MSEPGRPATLQEDNTDRVRQGKSDRRQWFMVRSRWIYWMTLETALEDLEMEPEDHDTNALRHQIVREMIRTRHPDYRDYAGEHRAGDEQGPTQDDLGTDLENPASHRASRPG